MQENERESHAAETLDAPPKRKRHFTPLSMLCIAVALLVGVFAGFLFGSGFGRPASGNDQAADAADMVDITPSPDKYTWYVKNYVGRNASACGSQRVNGKIMDYYGSASISLVFITGDGSAVTPKNMQKYKVVSQSPAPNTEIKLTYKKGDDGKDLYVDTKSLEEIILYVEKR